MHKHTECYVLHTIFVLINDTVSHLKIRRLKDGYEILACHKYRATP